MTFKKVKYYIILSLLVVMIVCVTAFSGFGTTSGAIDPILPEDPGSVEDPNLPEDPEDSEEDVTLPTFKTWDKLWEYSYNILLEGYASTFTMSVDANSMGVSAIQSFAGSENLNAENDELFLEYFPTNSNPLAGSSATYYEYERITYEKAEKRKTYNVNYAERTYNFTDEEISVRERNSEVSPILYGLRSLELNKNNVTVNSFDKLTNSSYYIIKLSYKLDKLTEGYYNGFTSTGLVESVDINAITIEIRISKKTGALYSITTTEDYKNNVSFLPITADCISTCVQVFQMS